MRLNHLGISGGKDSTALLLWAVHESGYETESLRATFADTGNECEETYDYVRMLSETVHPIEWLKPERDFYELAKHKGRFPSVTVRFCTTELKMKPSRAFAHALTDEGFEVLLHTGVRAGESAARSLLKEEDFDDWYGLRVRRPLLAWTIEDVWAIHERYGIPRNPLYAKGAKRVGCWPCIMSQKLEIRNAFKVDPAKFDRIRTEETNATATRDCNTFFSPDKIPARFRSREVMRKDGTMVRIAMIDDVIRWANSGYLGNEEPTLFEFEDEPGSTCSHTSGACE